MFKLYPSEKSILTVDSLPSLTERKKSIYLVFLAIMFIAVAIFYNYASSQDFVLNAVFWGASVASVVSLLVYIIKMLNAKKLDGKVKYYVTSTRVVAVDENDKVVREILRNKIKRVDVEYISGKSGDVIINPRDLSPQKRYQKELKGQTNRLYSKDTFILEGLKNADELVKELNI